MIKHFIEKLHILDLIGYKYFNSDPHEVIFNIKYINVIYNAMH